MRQSRDMSEMLIRSEVYKSLNQPRNNAHAEKRLGSHARKAMAPVRRLLLATTIGTTGYSAEHIDAQSSPPIERQWHSEGGVTHIVFLDRTSDIWNTAVHTAAANWDQTHANITVQVIEDDPAKGCERHEGQPEIPICNLPTSPEGFGGYSFFTTLAVPDHPGYYDIVNEHIELYDDGYLDENGYPLPSDHRYRQQIVCHEMGHGLVGKEKHYEPTTTCIADFIEEASGNTIFPLAVPGPQGEALVAERYNSEVQSLVEPKHKKKKKHKKKHKHNKKQNNNHKHHNGRRHR